MGDRAEEAAPASRYEAHEFEADPGDPEHCAVCGEGRAQIRHHPTRVAAARRLRETEPSSGAEDA